jgi:hypothetical protein
MQKADDDGGDDDDDDDDDVLNQEPEQLTRLDCAAG